MRQRTTWSKQAAETPHKAATQRKADIYTMNQEHPQPKPVDYENGSPDAWGETPVPAEKMSVKEEYEGDHVKRNELNFGEIRDDTWKHKDADQWRGKGKYDNAKVSAERKAVAAERVARAILRTSNEKLVEETAIDLMAVPAGILASTLKHLDQVSPDALPEEAKYRRALACCKLAARLLQVEDEKLTEHLGSIFMTLDDPTLKAILKTVAAARVAEQQEEQQEEQGQQEQQQAQAPVAQEEQQAAPAPVAQQQQEQAQQQEEQQEEEQQEQQGQQQEEAGLTAEELSCLNEMLQQPAAPPAPPPDGLQQLFAPAAPAAPIAAAPAAPPVAVNPDISFDDDDVEPTVAAEAPADDLDALFNDHPEVVAQREIATAELEQKAREGGFVAAGRTASKGVKKLGAVKTSKNLDMDAVLDSIWERPGQ